MITLHFDTEPKAVQSVKARVIHKGNKHIPIMYQPASVKEYKKLIANIAKKQYKGEPINRNIPLSISIEYVFKHPTNWSKKKIERLKWGEVVYKVTKPDVTDNLQKGFVDALAGIVWEADQQICEMDKVRKVWGLKSEINLIVEELV